MTAPASPAPVWAIVPVKAFAQSKTRLAGHLSDPERAALARGTFEHVLSVVTGARGLAGVVVATECPEVAALVGGRAELSYRPPTGEPLARVIDRVLQEVAARGARAAVVLMGDLPWLSATEVEALVAAVGRAPVALVPDERDDGSNGIGVRLPAPFPTAFAEPESFARHRELAAMRGLATEVVRAPGLAFDVDGPADLERLRRRRPEGGSGSAGRG